MNPATIDLLDACREEAGIPFEIKSGCRCPKHNAAVGGIWDSAHLVNSITRHCEAVDIKCFSMYDRFLMLQPFLKHFRHIGIAENFIHVDNAPDKPVGVYLYSSKK
jgi:hypothetical protein